MKKNIIKLLVVMAVLFGFGAVASFPVFAEEEAATSAGMSISLTPTSKILQINSGSTYDETMAVTNGGSETIRVEVYAAPYSYVYSSEEELYKLGFNNENNYTQLSRWITFKDANGNYVEKAVFAIEPEATLDVAFRITTPASIPNGGQYAVIFAHTLSNALTTTGIRTEASPGMVVYGRSAEGESVIDAEINGLEIERKIIDNKDSIVATAKVKNIGNVDFTAVGNLKVEPIIGFSSYESPVTNGRMSIIPEAELIVSDVWSETPGFGLFKATWTVTAGDKTETITRVIFKIPMFVAVIIIIVLTIIAISVIMGIRKRKERRARLAV